MCDKVIPQEDADHILAVGHKVMFQGEECVITSIRVWHDMGTMFGRPFRAEPVFDVKGKVAEGRDIEIDDLDLWLPPAQTSEEVEGNDKRHKQTEQSRSSTAPEESGQTHSDQEN